MLKQAEVPAISKAIDGLYVMNDNDRLKELARMREKAMHDRASELEEAILTGMERGRSSCDISCGRSPQYEGRQHFVHFYYCRFLQKILFILKIFVSTA